MLLVFHPWELEQKLKTNISNDKNWAAYLTNCDVWFIIICDMSICKLTIVSGLNTLQKRNDEPLLTLANKLQIIWPRYVSTKISLRQYSNDFFLQFGILPWQQYVHNRSQFWRYLDFQEFNNNFKYSYCNFITIHDHWHFDNLICFVDVFDYADVTRLKSTCRST